MRRIGNRAVSWVVVAAVTAMLSPVSMVFASVADDQVTSVKLKEADGTTGQDANLGSGVKTSHIQDGAVTDAKIVGTISTSKLSVGTIANTVAAGNHSHVIGTADLAANAVVSENLANGAVIASKLGAESVGTDALAVASVTSQKLAPNSVTAAAISSGAITNELIGGVISVDKLAVFANVKVVHKGASDGVNTFNTIQSAIDWITQNDPHIISQTSWDEERISKVIYVMPGLYTENLVIPNGIHLKGFGRFATIIAPATAGAVITYVNPDQNYSSGAISDIDVQGAIIGYIQYLHVDNANIFEINITSQGNIYGARVYAKFSKILLFYEHRNVGMNANHCEFNFIADVNGKSTQNFYYSTINQGASEIDVNSVMVYCNDGVNIIPNKP